ncbi:hypothetical protein AA101099_1761 [Neoasaia chiangmaiensis NBRC 101099]|uniref:Uncharacterized protein n=1 Tax=Neoasaia chiangmaiensis TaxID=320497 RepID=A0A1U9KR49_9PROT|nr:hypothetical protein [Neoasaia chiangmaiensis]AQS88283.1 hypothetical protein A0U93_10385 [Neoasaia chiangmaiensis]GBR39659.1 hypothetical protein AA101099_1761 [Neoasaia chiangmaiensis NBRC 101099]GEN14683.1 hypothetical protein NCH01_11140 [Neoasaia chiangmaiensis]
MFLNDEPSSVADMPAMPAATGNTPGWFTGGNPASGQGPSLVRFWHVNQLFAEFKAFLDAAGIAPQKGALNQVLTACQQMFAPASAVQGRLLRTQIFNGGTGFVSLLSTTRLIRLSMAAGGGAGGGVDASQSNGACAGSAGAAGAEIVADILVSAFANTSAIPFIIGTGGVGQSAANGTNGGATSFGSSTSGPYFSCGGGNGGVKGGNVGPGTSGQTGQSIGGQPTITNWSGTTRRAKWGINGPNGLVMANSGNAAGVALSGIGAPSSFASGGFNTRNGVGSNATGYAAGGGAAASLDGNAYAGGNGGGGILIVDEYS